MRPVRRLLPIVSLLSLSIVVAGCGAPGDSTPGACLQGPSFYVHHGRGGVLVSECLAQNQTAGDLAAVGDAMLTATTKLNAEARAKPGAAANLRLGYLLGAAQRGAGGTAGIHTELIRRLSAAARYSPENSPLPATFWRAYRQGFEAGRARG
jgi:hypothetical protein